jgi:hypothetical protein
LNICRIGSARWANGVRIEWIGEQVLLEAGIPFLYQDPREIDFFKKQGVFIVRARDDSSPSLLKENRKKIREIFSGEGSILRFFLITFFLFNLF